MFQFDIYSFYTKGYTAGFIPKDLADECKELISETKFEGDHVKYPSWNLLEGEDGADLYYEEVLRELKSLNCAPPEVKYIGERILSLSYFDDFKRRLVKPQHKNNTWMKTFVPNAYGMWNGQDDLPWHTDIDDGNDITILAYFTQDSEVWNKDWNGQIKIGVEDEFGEIHEVYEHYPIDSTFVVINNMNPLFYHKVIRNIDNTNRYTMSFRYLIK